MYVRSRPQVTLILGIRKGFRRDNDATRNARAESAPKVNPDGHMGYGVLKVIYMSEAELYSYSSPFASDNSEKGVPSSEIIS